MWIQPDRHSHRMTSFSFAAVCYRSPFLWCYKQYHCTVVSASTRKDSSVAVMQSYYTMLPRNIFCRGGTDQTVDWLVVLGCQILILLVGLAVNSFLPIKGKSRPWEELFSKYFVSVNVILNFTSELFIPLKPIPKEDILRRWRFCWLGNWQKVTEQTCWYMGGNSDSFTSSGKC